MTIKELASKTRQFNILYVEDEAEVREQMLMILGMLFKEVDSANDGEEGLEKYKTNPEKYELIITDITMPKMNGLELAQKVKEINPSQKIVVISAHREDEFLSQIKEIRIDGVIFKPVQLEEIALTFKEVMGL